jgi:hypothetical protein
MNPPPLALLGLFSAVYTSTTSQNIPIDIITTENDTKISFRMFDDSILMVFMHSGDGTASLSDDHIKKFMSFVSRHMLLF